jgi:hypothetical protein|nr:MAG TPA: hypothetical protein [Caudoviricetes sp.]
MANEKPISKEHADQIWEAVLTATGKGSLDAAIAANELINVRRYLDEQITPSFQTETASSVHPQESEGTEHPILLPTEPYPRL